MKASLTLLLSFSIALIFAQRTQFKSDNGFTGTFKLDGQNQLEKGSIILDNFNTSEGLFQKNDLARYNATFPFICYDCSFKIQSFENQIAQVTETEGNGFRHIINAVREHLKNINYGDSGVASTNYPTKKTNIQKADAITINTEVGLEGIQPAPLDSIEVAQIETKEIKITSPKDTIANKSQINASISKSKVDHNQGQEQTQSEKGITEQDKVLIVDQKLQKEYAGKKAAKCQQRLTLLNQKLKKAEEDKDYLLIQELTLAIEKATKKCS